MMVRTIFKNENGAQVGLDIGGTLVPFATAVALYQQKRLDNVILSKNEKGHFFRGKNCNINIVDARKVESYVKRNAGSMGLLQQGTKTNTGAVVTVRGCTHEKGKNSQVNRGGAGGSGNAQFVRKGRQAKSTSSLAGISVRGIKTEPAYKPSPQEFHTSFNRVKEGASYKCCVDTHSVSDLSDMVCIATDNNDGFIAVDKSLSNYGNICSVLKDASNNHNKYFLRDMFAYAVREGGTKLDCYNINNFLPKIYCNVGFIPVCKIKFNPEYKPDDWDDTLGEPDIVFMYYCGDTPEELLQKYKTYKSWFDYDVPYIQDIKEGYVKVPDDYDWDEDKQDMSDYSQASRYRDKVMERAYRNKGHN